jgi:hypothetical protein
MLINFDKTNYRIFFTNDQVICYICKQKNQTSVRCPQKNVTINAHDEKQKIKNQIETPVISINIK